MAPKVEISDETITRLIKDHLEKESEEPRLKRHMKRNWFGYTKLVAAIGALTAAINGYAELQGQNLNLAKENRVLFQALATKMNGMAERLAYMEGRFDGMSSEEAAEAVEEIITPLEPNGTYEEGEGAAEAASDDVEEPTSPRKGKKKRRDKPTKAKATIAAGAPQVQMKPAIKVKAYEQLPEDLSELIEIEDQVQEQMQEDEL